VGKKKKIGETGGSRGWLILGLRLRHFKNGGKKNVSSKERKKGGKDGIFWKRKLDPLDELQHERIVTHSKGLVRCPSPVTDGNLRNKRSPNSREKEV